MSAPAAPAALRARVLAAVEAAATPASLLRPPQGWGRTALVASVAAAAAVVVFFGGATLRDAPRRVAAPARWEALHPETPTSAPRIRVVDDADPTSLGAAAFVNAAFDPLEGP